MNTDKWNPGHSPNKGYPYTPPISMLLFKNRPKLWEKDSGQIAIDWDKELFAEVGPGTQDLLDFCLHRLIDFQEALKACEGQISDLLAEKPFTPEDFGFEVVVDNKDITEPPLRVFFSKHSEGVSLFRKPGNVGDDEWNPCLWTLMRKDVDKDGSPFFIQQDLNLPCARIAYAALYALGVKMPENTIDHEEAITGMSVMPSAMISVPKKFPLGYIGVKYEGGDRTLTFTVKAANEKEAFTKANFLLQADHDIFNAKEQEFSIITPEEMQEIRMSQFTPAQRELLGNRD